MSDRCNKWYSNTKSREIGQLIMIVVPSSVLWPLGEGELLHILGGGGSRTFIERRSLKSSFDFAHLICWIADEESCSPDPGSLFSRPAPSDCEKALTPDSSARLFALDLFFIPGVGESVGEE